MLKRLFICLIGIILLSGCSPKSTQEEIAFASWGSVTEVGVLKQIINDFESENPDIKIKFMHTPQNYFQKLHLLFASKSAPDVIFINNLYLPLYASQLENLTEYIDKNKFYPQSIEGLSYNNKLMAIPRDISNLIFYVNKDIVQNGKFSTLEDLLKTTQIAFQKNVFGISFEEDMYWALPYLAYYNESFDENFNVSRSKGLKFYKDLRDKYKVAPTKAQVGSSTLAQMFLDKKIAIYLSGRWMYPKISEKANFDWGIAPFPIGSGYLPCDTSGWAISKDSVHKESAIKFIQYLSSEKSSEYFLQTGLIVPARIKTSQKLNKDFHNEKVFLEVITNSKATKTTKDYKKLSDKFNTSLR